MKDCGWEEAALCEQQDSSEAFSFITETLQLPLLTLKMDIFHTGAEDDKDDHKLIQERLLEVAVPDETPGSEGITLEHCLENYFNNRVEVRRHLARSNTLSSVKSGKEVKDEEASQHVEVTELAWSTPNTPISGSLPSAPIPIRPGGRLRTTSIIRQRVVEEKPQEDGGSSEIIPGSPSTRKGSLRKEVLMPAWQFFNLLRPSPIYFGLVAFYNSLSPMSILLIKSIAWYNRTQPALTDADVASHFVKTRPVLGICLKRYGWREDSTPFRKNTFIDIPTDTKVPHFVEDDAVVENGPLLGNFKLSLQSVICHRGASVNAGHYISFIRAKSLVSDGDIESDQQLNDSDEPPTYAPERWLRHDDMTYPRVAEITDIKKALRQEMPYLLFYQVLPVNDVSPPPGLEPPAYADSGVAMRVNDTNPTTSTHPSPPVRPGYFDGSSTPTIRLSSELDRMSEPLQALSVQDGSRRGSLAPTDNSIVNSVSHTIAVSAPVSPNEESTAQRMSRAAQRFTKSGSRSRPTSSSGENRISSSFTRTINLMKSNASLTRVDTGKSDAGKEASHATDGERSARPSMDDNSSRPGDDTNAKPVRTRSKRGRGRNKSKDHNTDKSEMDHHHHHHSHSLHSLKSKGKEKDSDGPDRECTLM